MPETYTYGELTFCGVTVPVQDLTLEHLPGPSVVSVSSLYPGPTRGEYTFTTTFKFENLAWRVGRLRRHIWSGCWAGVRSNSKQARRVLRLLEASL